MSKCWGERSCKVLLLATAIALALPMAAQAQSSTSAAAEQRSFDIAGGTLAQALSRFSEQSGIQVMYEPALVEGKHAAALRVSGTTASVLAQLLKGSDLVYEFVNSTTVVIRKPDKPAPTKPAAPRHQAVPAVAQQPAPTELERVQVTGSRLNRTEAEGPQPLLIFKREQIERSGQTSVVDFLRTLPEVSGNGTNVESSFGGNPHAQTVQLRGLPTGRTLILINGRRMPNSGMVDGGFADINSIPAAAVERIDVLPQGASAIYGSDALAGVINIVLRRDVDGAHVDAKFGGADGTSDRNISMVWGKASDRGSISLIANYYDRTPLYANERDQFNDVDFTRHGWRDVSTTTCNPGTVYSTNGGNLPGLDSATAAIPQGIGATPTVADFAATTGQANKCYSGGLSLLFGSSRLNLMSSMDWRLGDTTTLFAELAYSRQHHEFTYPFTLSKALVPASNPFNPFGEDVRVDYRFPSDALNDAISDTDSQSTRVVAGARGDLGGDWQWEVTGWANREHAWSIFRVPNAAYADPGLSSIDPGTALNLFVSGPPASQDILDAYANAPGALSLITTNATTTTRGVNALLRGSLFPLPGGDLAAAVGGEYSRESFENAGTSRGVFDIGRNIKALYGELRAPLLARHDGDGETRELLTLSAALRRDDYSDFGTATTPQYGIEFRPSKSLLFRASYAEAFRAPDLYAVYGPNDTFVYSGLVMDPRRNGELSGDSYVSGGNPNLQPETGRSLSAGFVWSSERWSGLDLSVNWWRIDMTDRISLFPSMQMIVDNEDLFPGRVTRAAPQGDGLPGRITRVDYSALNLGDIWVAGVDFGIDYRFDTAFGIWSSSARATHYTRYDALLDPDVGVSDYLGKANTDIWVPSWRGNIGLNWRLNAWSAGLIGRYVGHYRDYNPLSDGRYQQLGNFWIWDANVRWEIGQDLALQNRLLSKAYVSLGAVDLFDHTPEFSATTSPGYGWDAAQNDIRGRYVYLQFGLSF